MRTQIEAFALFSRGLGGCSHAVRYFPAWKAVAAVDKDETMLGNFVLDHDFRLLKDLSLLQTELGSEPAALLADVMHSDWLQITMLRDLDAWFLSFPRQPRASMGTGSGISGENRSAPIRALQRIRMAQPAQVLLENVAGFCQHH